MSRIVPAALVLLIAAACASPAHKKAQAAAAKPAPAAAAPMVAGSAPVPAGQPAPAAAPALPSKTNKVAAIVTAVDAKSGTVSVRFHHAVHVLRVAQGAKLTKGGDDASIDLGDVAVGSHLSLAYSGDVLASLHVKVYAGGSASASKVAKK